MKSPTFAVLTILLLSAALALAHGNETADSNGHTAAEETEGKALWDKFQNKETACADFSADDFAALGEYFMGQMLGTSHEAMNNMMTRMMGEAGEKEMHVVMGKRMSSCDTSAAFPLSGIDFMPLMGMMGGDWSSPSRFNLTTNPMMWNFGSGPMGWLGLGFGWIFMIFWWLLIIAGIVFLVRWLINQAKGDSRGKTAVDILKERYARGEISKAEFEEKKKDLT